MNGRDFLCYMIGVLTMAITPTILTSCAAKTTGVNVPLEGPTGDIDTGDDSPALQPTAGEDAIAVAGPTGETAAVGTGAQVSQITIGNIAWGGGWLAVPLTMFVLLVARRRRLAVERVYDCGIIASKNPNMLDNLISDRGLRPPLIPMRGGRKQKLDAPGRVIARAVKRVTNE